MRDNRRHLRSIMALGGLGAYECEWWHSTLADEPYPDTYFAVAVARPVPR